MGELKIKYIQIYDSYLEAVEMLSDAARGRLFTALMRYRRTGEAETLKGNERFIFPLMRAQIDRDNGTYEKKCSQLGENSRRRNQLIPNEDKEKEKEKKIEKKIEKDKESEKAKEELRLVYGKHCGSMGEGLRTAVDSWIKYKHESGKGYKPSGLNTLLMTVNRQTALHGETAVAELIEMSAGNGWVGIAWDKLGKAPPNGNEGRKPTGTPKGVKPFLGYTGRELTGEYFAEMERIATERMIRDVGHERSG